MSSKFLSIHIIFILFTIFLVFQSNQSNNDFYYRHNEPLFLSRTQYLYLRTENQLKKIQTVALNSNPNNQDLQNSLNGEYISQIIPFSFKFSGNTESTFDQFCRFISYDQESGWFWIHAKMIDSSSCTLFYGEEDSQEMKEIQPRDIINQDIETSLSNITPISVTLNFDNRKRITLVTGIRNSQGKYELFKIITQNFEKVEGVQSNTPILFPVTWKNAYPTSFDNSNLKWNSQKIIDLRTEEFFYFIVNNRELWKMNEDLVEKVGDLKFDLHSDSNDVGLINKFLFFVPFEEDILIFSSGGKIDDTIQFFNFSKDIIPSIEYGKIVPYSGNDKHYFYFIAKELVTKKELTDLEGAGKTDTSFATPKFNDKSRLRSYLFRCSASQCSRFDLVENIDERDPSFDPITLHMNKFLPSSIFVGSKYSIQLIHFGKSLDPFISLNPETNTTLRVLDTNGVNVIFETCPSDSSDTTPKCSISLFRPGEIIQFPFNFSDSTKSSLTPDSVVVEYSNDGSLLQFIISNGDKFESQILSSNIAEGCSPQCVHGKCILKNEALVCACDKNFVGTTCNECIPGFSGPNCDIQCNTTTCQHGTCVNGKGCVCFSDDWGGYWDYLNPEQLCGKCKYSGMDPSKLCKKNQCLPGFYGELCDRYCNPTVTCSNHGVCDTDGNCKCYSDSSQGFWEGYSCNICQGNFDESKSCKSCKEGYSGPKCLKQECFGIPASSPNVCSRRGKCLDGVCLCNDINEFFGSQCQFFHCFNQENESPKACSGHGNCVAPNQCNCLDGWTGDACNQQKSSLFIWIIIFLIILIMTFVLIGIIIWKRFPQLLRNQFYKRKGFSQLGSMNPYESQLYEMNEEMGSDTEDFDTENESENDKAYDTDEI